MKQLCKYIVVILISFFFFSSCEVKKGNGNLIAISSLLEFVKGDEENKADEADEADEEDEEKKGDEELNIIETPKSISAGSFSTIALNKEGYLYVWGGNKYGSLDGQDVDENNYIDEPKKIGNRKYKMVSAGDYHQLALDKEGYLYFWGSGSDGTTEIKVPTKVIDKKFKLMSGGSRYSLALDKEGYLYSWGGNYYGQLGDGTKTKRDAPVKIGNRKYATVDAGSSHSLALDEEGYLYVWGGNIKGALGIGKNTGRKTTRILSPKKIEDKKYKMISAGYDYSLALDEEGFLYAWGNNQFGQLGDGTKTNKYVPKKIGNKKYKMISAGHYHSLAIDEEGYLYSWGSNYYGELGVGKFDDGRTEPTKVSNNKKYQSVISGNEFSLSLDINGNLYAWGHNTVGQLGIGDENREIKVRRRNIGGTSKDFKYVGTPTEVTGF